MTNSLPEVLKTPKMVYQIKTPNAFDKRRWIITETTNRLDVVKELGLPFSPKQAMEQATEFPGKFRYIRQSVAIKVTIVEE